MEGFNINAVIESIIKKWKIILIIFVSAFVVTLTYLVLVFDKRYESEAKVLIPKSTLTTEYSKIILDNDLLENVSSGFENISVDELRKSISVDNSESKISVIKIVVKNKNSQIAYEIATDISNSFISKIKNIYGITNATISSKPVIDESNISGKDILQIVKKSIIYPLGIVVFYILIVVFIEYLCGKYVDKSSIDEIFKDGILLQLPDFEKKYIKDKEGYIKEQFEKLKSRIEFKCLNDSKNIILFSTTSSINSISYIVDKLASMFVSESKSVCTAKLVKGQNVEEKLKEYSNNYDLVFIETYDFVSSAYSEEILNKFSKVILIEDMGKTNYRELQKAKDIFKFYNIKNVSIIINKNLGIEEVFKYKKFENRLKEVKNS